MAARQRLQRTRDLSVSGRYREAIEMADEGLSLLPPGSRGVERERTRLDLLLERGHARVLMGDYAACSDFEAIQEQASEPLQQILARLGVADCQSGTGEYEAAERHYRQAIEEAQNVGHDLGMIRGWRGLASLYWKQGRIDEAVQAVSQARAILQRSPDVGELGHTLLSLGIAQQLAGRLDQAITAYEEALNCFRTLGDRHRVAAVLNNLGELHQELRDLNRALQYHEEAVKVAIEVGAERMEIDIVRNIGVDLLLLGRYSEAMLALDKSLAQARQLGDKDHILQALYSLGDACLRQGDVERAMQLTQELSAEAEAVKSEFHAARAKYLQGRAHLARGERGAAQAVLQDALGEAHALPSRILLWQLHAALGRASEDHNLAQIHFRIAADFIQQTVEPLNDPEMRTRFLEQPEVRAVLERAR